MIAFVLGASLGMAAACAPATPSPEASPGASIAGVPSAQSTASPDQSPVASVAATPSPSASAIASSSPSACAVVSQTGVLPSDRLVNMVTATTSTHDLVTFVFVPSTPGPGGPPRGTLEPAQSPFTYAGSGAPIDLVGEHALQLRFTGMTIASETGEAVYQGLPAFATNGGTFRDAILYDASEGIIGWYIGYDGPGCVSLVRDGNDVTVRIAHPETPAG